MIGSHTYVPHLGTTGPFRSRYVSHGETVDVGAAITETTRDSQIVLGLKVPSRRPPHGPLALVLRPAEQVQGAYERVGTMELRTR